jgi:hypothetical protein
VLEWKQKIPEIEKESADIYAEALAYFEMPRPYSLSSPELDSLKIKYGAKLQEAAVPEPELDFSLTKILAPLIEGKYG